jgi:hypothetical protein
MALENWFDTYPYEIDYDVGESAVKYLSLGDINIDPKSILLRSCERQQSTNGV